MIKIPAEIDSETKKQIVLKRGMDYNKNRIAKDLDISPTTVDKYLQKFRETIKTEKVL